MVGYNGLKAAMGLFGNATFDGVNLSYALFLVVICIATIVGFFTRKRWTPILFISFFVLNLLYVLYIAVIMYSNFPERVDYVSLVRVVVLCLVVIPYMLRSERVREVFVN